MKQPKEMTDAEIDDEWQLLAKSPATVISLEKRRRLISLDIEAYRRKYSSPARIDKVGGG